MSESEQAWVPAACTLPTVERPVRVAEFDELFAASARAVHRVDRRHARLELVPDPAVAARVAELMTRETGCCSFFVFTLSATGGALALEIGVPDDQLDVLDAFVDRAAGLRR